MVPSQASTRGELCPEAFEGSVLQVHRRLLTQEHSSEGGLRGQACCHKHPETWLEPEK